MRGTTHLAIMPVSRTLRLQAQCQLGLQTAFLEFLLVNKHERRRKVRAHHDCAFCLQTVF